MKLWIGDAGGLVDHLWFDGVELAVGVVVKCNGLELVGLVAWSHEDEVTFVKGMENLFLLNRLRIFFLFISVLLHHLAKGPLFAFGREECHAHVESAFFLGNCGTLITLVFKFTLEVLLDFIQILDGFHHGGGSSLLATGDEGPGVKEVDELVLDLDLFLLLLCAELTAPFHGMKNVAGEEVGLDGVDHVVKVLSGQRPFKLGLRKILRKDDILEGLLFKLLGLELGHPGHGNDDDLCVFEELIFICVKVYLFGTREYLSEELEAAVS